MIRPFEHILEPDPRHTAFVRLDDLQPVSLKDYYDGVQDTALCARVPTAVQTVFERARAAFLYSWFSYELTTLAQGQACAALELALSQKLEARYPGQTYGALNKCLEKAIADGDFCNFSAREGDPPHTRDDLDNLRRLLVLVRNDVSHGTEMVMMPGQALDILKVCGRLIDHLFSEGEEGGVNV